MTTCFMHPLYTGTIQTAGSSYGGCGLSPLRQCAAYRLAVQAQCIGAEDPGPGGPPAGSAAGGIGAIVRRRNVVGDDDGKGAWKVGWKAYR